MRRPRSLVAVGAAITLAGLALLRRREEAPERDDRRRAGHAVHRVSRRHRTAHLVRVGASVGTGEVTHRARRVFASAARREELDRSRELKTAAQVTEALGSMKGVLMKLGQMASYLDDGLPEPIRDALSSLQQDAPPMSPELAAEVIERELGRPPDQIFAEWDPVPIAAASIGQVHRAMTRDGQAVAVKVQYPGVEEAIEADLANAPMVFGAIGLVSSGFDPAPFVEELRARFREEADYRLEADNQRLFARLYADHPFISVPAVVDGLSTRRVLTSELATGSRWSEVLTWSQEERDLAGESIYRYVFRSINRFHVFNGDPHPGNYLFEPGGKVTFLDYGLVKHFDVGEVATFHRMIRAMVLEPDVDEYRRALEDASLLRPGAPLSDEELLDYFGRFYELLFTDERRPITHEYSAELVRRLLDIAGDHRDLTKHANLPPSFVILQRINLGLFALLADLGSVANWRRIAEELWPMTDGPPSTELGEAEAKWLATRPTT